MPTLIFSAGFQCSYYSYFPEELWSEISTFPKLYGYIVNGLLSTLLHTFEKECFSVCLSFVSVSLCLSQCVSMRVYVCVFTSEVNLRYDSADIHLVLWNGNSHIGSITQIAWRASNSQESFCFSLLRLLLLPLLLPTFSPFFPFFLVYVCGCLCHSQHMKVRRQLGKSFVSLHYVGPGFQLRSSDLTGWLSHCTLQQNRLLHWYWRLNRPHICIANRLNCLATQEVSILKVMSITKYQY